MKSPQKLRQPQWKSQPLEAFGRTSGPTVARKILKNDIKSAVCLHNLRRGPSKLVTKIAFELRLSLLTWEVSAVCLQNANKESAVCLHIAWVKQAGHQCKETAEKCLQLTGKSDWVSCLLIVLTRMHANYHRWRHWWQTSILHTEESCWSPSNEAPKWLEWSPNLRLSRQR